LKLVAGQAFRAPNAYETYYAMPGQKLNPDLHAETIRTEEVVVEQWLGQRLRLSASAHKNDIDGLISEAVDPNDGKTFLANNDYIRGQGVELQLDGKLNNGVEGRASYSYEDDNTNGQLSNLPRHLAKFNLTAPLLQRRLFAGWESQYTSKRSTLAGNYLGGFAIANLTLSARNLGKHSDLSFSLYNLFGRKYSQPGGPENVQDSLPQDGRSFRVKVGYHF
jgi:outer membrane receptor for ferrienterochelin and colicins